MSDGKAVIVWSSHFSDKRYYGNSDEIFVCSIKYITIVVTA